jgi:hypothetical protein
MHVPSPSDYFPLDSYAAAAFKTALVNRYITLAFATLVLYNHLITLDIEVERIWTLKWGLPKVLFLTSRYVVPPLLMITVIGQIGYPLLFSFCKFEVQFGTPIVILSLVTAQLVLLMRVSALYGHNKFWLSFLLCFFTCQLAVVIAATVITIKMQTPELYYQFIPGCWYNYNVTQSSLRWEYSWWIPFICFDGVLLILTLIKAFSYWDHNFNPTIRLLARDSIVYFAIMFGCVVMNITAYFNSTGSFSMPAEWIACIAVSQMMMNIRSLAFNSPLASQGVNFSAIIFRRAIGSRGAGTEQHVSRV